MRTLLLLFLVASQAWATPYIASSTGDWSSSATWGGAGPVPGNGDTATVNDGVTVTVATAVVVGTSGANGTVAINMGNTGAVIISSTGELQLRGEPIYTGGS